MRRVFQSTKQAIKRLASWQNQVFPWHRGAEIGDPVSLYCVFRTKNTPIIAALISQLPIGSQVALHCLDGDGAGQLEAHTVSHGPGMRMPLLQSLISAFPPIGAVLIADDDVALPGTLPRFLGLAKAGDFDLCQPAHGLDSLANHNLNKYRPFVTARQTMFVEVGPLVYLSLRAQSLVFPFPDRAQMGWGIDILWSSYRAQGLRLGVVDATPMHHSGAIGAEYVPEAEREVSSYYLEELGIGSIFNVLKEIPPRWRPWQKHAPWLR